jgi:hypothetical protein
MDAIVTSHAAFDRAIAPLVGIFSQDQVARLANFHADTVLQKRIEELAKKANEGELTETELAEYEGYAQANRFVALLQANAERLVEGRRDTQ